MFLKKKYHSDKNNTKKELIFIQYVNKIAPCLFILLLIMGCKDASILEPYEPLQQMSVSHTNTLSIGSAELTISTGIEGAVVELTSLALGINETGSTDANGFFTLSINTISGGELTLRITADGYDTYEACIIIQDNSQAVDVIIKFLNSQGQGIPGAEVSYLNLDTQMYQIAGSTDINGELSYTMVSGIYEFSLSYMGKNTIIFQNIEQNPVISFQSVKATVTCFDKIVRCEIPKSGVQVSLFNTNLQEFQEMGITDENGKVDCELLPALYQFKVSISGEEKEKEQHIGKNPFIIFYFDNDTPPPPPIVEVTVRIVNVAGNRIPGVEVYYFDNDTQEYVFIGQTGEYGEVSLDLAAGIQVFRLVYQGQTFDISQDIAIDPLVISILE